VVAGAVALLTGGGDGPRDQPTAQREPDRTSTPDATRTPEATPTETPETATPTPTPTEEPEQTATPTPTAEPEQGGGGQGRGNDPAALQLRAFQLNNAGDHRQALVFARKAVKLCQGSTAVSPCAYALYEYARALRLTGDPAGAIAVLEERMQRFPDNQPGTVAQELERAREAAGQSD
jgi:tetratricopeptide (TPR) repeat protein